MLGILSIIFACILQLTETANATAIISKPSSPLYAVEENNYTLEWTYTLDGSVGAATFAIVNDDKSDSAIGSIFGPGNVTFLAGFQARFRAHVTETRAELTFLAVRRSDEGKTYKFSILTTKGRSISDMWFLVVNFPPSIIGVTGNTSVMEGGNMSLNCSAMGKPEPRITWTRLADNRAVTMPLINISRHDVRHYRCTAENGVGNPATRNVTIDVQYAPERVTLITNPLISHKVCAGTVTNFTCAVEASNPIVKAFTLFGNGRMISSKRDPGVWIRTLTTSGNATYKCTASNSVGVSSSDYIDFTVEVPASVTNISNSIIVKEGQNVTLVCHGFGLPAPIITWSDARNEVMENGYIWKLPKVNRNMAGQYSCTASNACGKDSRKVDIDVQYPVEATARGENAFVAEGLVKTFTCPVNGNPEPNIEWYSKETGRKISSGKQYKTEESGCYSCVASNSIGVAVNITHCLIVENESSTAVPSTTVSGDILELVHESL